VGSERFVNVNSRKGGGLAGQSKVTSVIGRPGEWGKLFGV